MLEMTCSFDLLALDSSLRGCDFVKRESEVVQEAEQGHEGPGSWQKTWRCSWMETKSLFITLYEMLLLLASTFDITNCKVQPFYRHVYVLVFA